MRKEEQATRKPNDFEFWTLDFGLKENGFHQFKKTVANKNPKDFQVKTFERSLESNTAFIFTLFFEISQIILEILANKKY